MGVSESKISQSQDRDVAILRHVDSKNFKEKMTRNDIVQHFMPASFPLNSILTPYHLKKVKSSWMLLKSGSCEGFSAGTGGRSGLVFFFDEFYLRLFQRSKKFRAYFGADLKKRGEILLRIIQFVTSLDISDKDKIESQINILGRAHAKRNIRPWMYSVFVETLIETIMYCLGEDGSFEVSLSWTFTFSFTMEILLRHALKGKLLDSEFSTNYFGKDMTETSQHTSSPASTPEPENVRLIRVASQMDL